MTDRSKPGWAAVAAAIPSQDRFRRELPFWRELARAWRWRRVADAGCGGGFHVTLLREIGLDVVGFDLAVAALAAGVRVGTAAGDLLAPPLRPVSFDAVLCLGNTFSLLPDRRTQQTALEKLATLVVPGGQLLLQAEDAGAVAAAGPLVRARRLEDGALHLRVFERRGRRVRMLAGVARAGRDEALREAWLLPTTPSSLTALAAPLGLGPVALPLPAPAGAGWWLALTTPTNGS